MVVENTLPEGKISCRCRLFDRNGSFRGMFWVSPSEAHLLFRRGYTLRVVELG